MWNRTKANARTFWRSEDGQGLPEYALLVASVVVLVVLMTALYSEEMFSLFNKIGTYIDGRI